MRLELEQRKGSWRERRWGVVGREGVWIAIKGRDIAIATSGPAWQLRRGGWFTPRVNGTATDGETLFLRGRRLELAAGRYEWKRAWRAPRRSWRRDGNVAAAFSTRGWRGRRIEVDRLDETLERPTAELLALLGVYVLSQERASAAAASTTTYT